MIGEVAQEQDSGRLLTRLRSVVLPPPLAAPASPLSRLVKPPTLLPMLLLKTPLLPELDMMGVDWGSVVGVVKGWK